MFTFPVMHFSGGIPVDYLVVAGGGGGGKRLAAGGGAGGFRTNVGGTSSVNPGIGITIQSVLVTNTSGSTGGAGSNEIIRFWNDYINCWRHMVAWTRDSLDGLNGGSVEVECRFC